MSLFGIDGVSVSGDFGFEQNTMPDPVVREIEVGGMTKVLNVAGDLTRFGGDNINISVFGQTLSGNLVVEKTGAVVGVALSDVTFELSDGQKAFLSITEGQGALVLDTNGIAGAFSGTAAGSGCPPIDRPLRAHERGVGGLQQATKRASGRGSGRRLACGNFPARRTRSDWGPRSERTRILSV